MKAWIYASRNFSLKTILGCELDDAERAGAFMQVEATEIKIRGIVVVNHICRSVLTVIVFRRLIKLSFRQNFDAILQS